MDVFCLETGDVITPCSSESIGGIFPCTNTNVGTGVQNKVSIQHSLKHNNDADVITKFTVYN